MSEGNGICVEIPANPDVSGLGIRISLYSLCLGGRILNFLVERLATDREARASFVGATNNALSMQGLALLGTAIVQTAQGQLTLFHAIVVLHLLALLGINLASKGLYRRNLTVRRMIDAAIVGVTVAAFIALHVYVWIKAPDLGPAPECNAETVYVIFGVSVYATADVFRYIILATFAIVPAVFILVLVLGLPCWVAMCFKRGDRRVREPNRSGEGCLGGCFTASFDTDDEADRVSTRTRDGNKLIQDGLQAVGYTVFSIYAIVSLEQMIRRNDVGEGESEWTFGQIIAIFLLLGTGYELLGVIISSCGPRKRRTRESVPMDPMH